MTRGASASYGVGTLEAVQTFLKRKANERRLIMASNARLRNCVLMLALLGGTALMPAERVCGLRSGTRRFRRHLEFA